MGYLPEACPRAKLSCIDVKAKPFLAVVELNGDPVSGLADAAFQHIPHPKFMGDGLNIDGLALVGEGGIAGNPAAGKPAGDQNQMVCSGS